MFQAVSILVVPVLRLENSERKKIFCSLQSEDEVQLQEFFVGKQAWFIPYFIAVSFLKVKST